MYIYRVRDGVINGLWQAPSFGEASEIAERHYVRDQLEGRYELGTEEYREAAAELTAEYRKGVKAITLVGELQNSV